MSLKDQRPTVTKGRINGRRKGQLRSNGAPNKSQSIPLVLNNRRGINRKEAAVSAGLTTIDRRPGRPTFHHMGPLPEASSNIRRPDGNINVSTIFLD